jgi:hypothetical protein
MYTRHCDTLDTWDKVYSQNNGPIQNYTTTVLRRQITVQMKVRSIDGDGYVIEDTPRLLEHMETPYHTWYAVSRTGHPSLQCTRHRRH